MNHIKFPSLYYCRALRLNTATHKKNMTSGQAAIVQKVCLWPEFLQNAMVRKGGRSTERERGRKSTGIQSTPREVMAICLTNMTPAWQEHNSGWWSAGRRMAGWRCSKVKDKLLTRLLGTSERADRLPPFPDLATVATDEPLPQQQPEEAQLPEGSPSPEGLPASEGLPQPEGQIAPEGPPPFKGPPPEGSPSPEGLPLLKDYPSLKDRMHLKGHHHPKDQNHLVLQLFKHCWRSSRRYNNKSMSHFTTKCLLCMHQSNQLTLWHVLNSRQWSGGTVQAKQGSHHCHITCNLRESQATTSIPSPCHCSASSWVGW